MEVYFDNSATTKPYEEVIEIVAESMRNYYGNPSSAHGLGFKAEQKLNEKREFLASTINCKKEEIIFTSGGSESNNLLIRGFVKEGGHLITSKIEHPSVLNTCKYLENQGVKVTYLEVDNYGRVDLEQLKESITSNTQLVSIMHVNNEIGTVQQLATIGKIIKEKSNRAKFHVDAIQSYGKYKIDVNKAKIDILSASAHKIHGPKGVGMSYVKKGLMPKAQIFGGSQERNLRAGTENLPGIMGFAKASEIIHKNIDENFKNTEKLKSYFIEKLSTLDNIKINSIPKEYFSPYILSVSFTGIRGEVLLHSLEEKGIYVSTGSACNSKDTRDSHVLLAIGLKNKDIKGTIRFSFNSYNTIEEIDYTMEHLKNSIKYLR